MRKNPSLVLGNYVSLKNVVFSKNNFLASFVRFTNSSIEEYSYIGEYSDIRNTNIGKFTCIGPKVMIGLGRHPTDTFTSLHPIFYSPLKQVGKSFVQESYFVEYGAQTNIGHDVWIGANVVVTKPINIGNGAIIATGSIVTKDVAPYTIVAGNPAKPVRKRFSEEEITFLEKTKWWLKDEKWFKENIHFMHNLSLFKEKFNEKN